ncbi:DNA-dependent ATPase fun30 [Vermiconidia calcicola]|uniref:DNA-dependent ATPase fun30 n=1 Tax=Vermiconidia calcicola TaxID=1690605 RepID=A0ACC3NM95_9PEZI|nr:DNA-dependent ATPase fun30 [Vermiconidia calcicola]
MADSDPISDSTPHKRRKLNDGSKGWDSQDDSGEDFIAEDFDTVATLPVVPPQQPRLHYSKEQFHRDLNPSSSSMTARASSPARPYITQPTQTLKHTTQPTQTLRHTTQPTQPISTGKPWRSDNIQVERSSPTTQESPKKPPPQPIRKAPFAKPAGLLASAMAPPGTTFRRPVYTQPKPVPIEIESDEEDPPVHYSSDEETQGLSSNLKPTNFKKGGRGLDSTPNRSDTAKHSDPVVRESPRSAPAPPGVFSSLMREFGHSSSGNDMASAYGSSSRPPRPTQVQKPVKPRVTNEKRYNTLDDIEVYAIRMKVQEIQCVYQHESIQRCVDALSRGKGNVADAMEWLAQDEEQDAPGEDDADELSGTTPVTKRGVAISKASQNQSSQPVRPAAKQEVKAPTRTIAEKYTGSTQARRPSQADEEDVKPKRRLQQGRKTRSPSLPSSPLGPAHKPPQPVQRSKKPTVVILDDSESDSGVGREESPEVQEVVESSFDRRLLNFFNECSVQDLADLSAQPQDAIAFVLEKRPFEGLDVIRTISNETKSGKKSRSRPVGDRIVDVCEEMFKGYDAVDELVEQCETIARPIQEALKGWGGGANTDGELQLMNLDEAHDSGIGTPSSSCPSPPGASEINHLKPKAGARFLGQPTSMNAKATLKDYQLVGLNWLNLLWSKEMSCILADDMGLGKTCQVIAFLAHLQQQQVDGVHLVIVPGSTLENWLREFEHFAPALRVVPYYGSQAERPSIQQHIEDNFDNIDVIVTTYDMAVKPDDNKFLRKSVDPMVCIYDEAHALRNPESDRYKQLTRIPATFKVLLTGTPLQNNLQELVAILAFIMPKLFAEKRDELRYIFQHKASTKDADHAALLSAERIARARSMMTPFILRRKKQQVLDLPVKHSRVQHCDMTAIQANYYGDLLDDAHQFFADKAKATKKGTTKQSSNILMALRKAAIHPLLARRIYDDQKIDKIVDLLLKHEEFAGNPRDRVRAYLSGDHHQSFKGGDYGIHCFCNERPYLRKFALKKHQWMDGAGKINAFRELVGAFAANGDRSLVFSQFTTMMDILEAVLETMGIKFMRLDGSTSMQVRQDMIDQFTNDTSIPVFMLSTKAGGAGINLAAANKVIVFDSGFNPQDDIQAENRAHRVGQTRDVEVVRLVTRGTIEEQIYALGESKLALDERVAGEGATAAEDKQAEKMGAEIVEKMFLNKLKEEETGDSKLAAGAGKTDMKDAFKAGLESSGLKVASKQAQF